MPIGMDDEHLHNIREIRERGKQVGYLIIEHPLV